MPSLLRRGIVYLLGIVILSGLGALVFGKVSVVVSGRGRIVPEGDVVLVQAQQNGVVKAVLARPGDRLPAGGALAKLDVSEAGVALTELQQKAAVLRGQLDKVRATRAFADRILADPAGALRGGRQPPATVGNVMRLVNELENTQARVDAAEAAAKNWAGRRGGMVRDIELTRERATAITAAQLAQAHHLFGPSAWVSIWLNRETDLDNALVVLNEAAALAAQYPDAQRSPPANLDSQS